MHLNFVEACIAGFRMTYWFFENSTKRGRCTTTRSGRSPVSRAATHCCRDICISRDRMVPDSSILRATRGGGRYWGEPARDVRRAAGLPIWRLDRRSACGSGTGGASSAVSRHGVCAQDGLQRAARSPDRPDFARAAPGSTPRVATVGARRTLGFGLLALAQASRAHWQTG